MKLNIDDIKLNRDKLLKCGVGAMVLFGSHVEGTYHPGSDIDVGVIFHDLNPLKKDPVEVYGLLHEELAHKIGDNIDIVYMHETPLSLRFNAVTDGMPIFFISENFFYDYKEHIINLYLDFRFFEKIFDEAILEG